MIKLFWQTLTGTKPKQSLESEISEDAKYLDRQILENELIIIEKKHKVLCQRVQRKYLADWLVSREPSSSKT